MTAFELAIQDVTGIGIAERVGADRIELCAALRTGGLTPSRALIAAAAAAVETHVLIRPREGGFNYDADERALIVADARAAVAEGAAGVVIGGTDGAQIDTELVRSVQEVSPQVTFHRAFDTLPDLDRSLATLIELGVQRVLTSGGANRAVEGLNVLTRLVRRAGNDLEVMAGAGITAGNVAIVAATGVSAVHGSAKRRVGAGVELTIGSADNESYETTDEAAAAAVVTVLRGGQ